MNSDLDDLKNSEGKDTWDKLKIIAEIIIAMAVLFSSIYFSVQSERIQKSGLNISYSNTDLTRVELKRALIPLLTGDNSKQRALALKLAERLDPAFAGDVSYVMASSDPDQNVRSVARKTLVSLSKSDIAVVRQSAERGIKSLKSNTQDGLAVSDDYVDSVLKKIDLISNNLNTDNYGDKKTAIDIYREVLGMLKGKDRMLIDKVILKKAEIACDQHDYEEAFRMYQSLFGGAFISRFKMNHSS